MLRDLGSRSELIRKLRFRKRERPGRSKFGTRHHNPASRNRSTGRDSDASSGNRDSTRRYRDTAGRHGDSAGRVDNSWHRDSWYNTVLPWQYEQSRNHESSSAGHDAPEWSTKHNYSRNNESWDHPAAKSRDHYPAEWKYDDSTEWGHHTSAIALAEKLHQDQKGGPQLARLVLSIEGVEAWTFEK